MPASQYGCRHHRRLHAYFSASCAEPYSTAGPLPIFGSCPTHLGWQLGLTSATNQDAAPEGWRQSQASPSPTAAPGAISAVRDSEQSSPSQARSGACDRPLHVYSLQPVQVVGIILRDESSPWRLPTLGGVTFCLFGCAIPPVQGWTPVTCPQAVRPAVVGLGERRTFFSEIFGNIHS